MARKWLNKAAAINATTLYKDGNLIATDVDFSLPAVTPAIVELDVGMGTFEVPMTGRFDSMEFSITKQGIDSAFADLSEPGAMNLELRWAQEMVYDDAVSRPVGCKAFLRCRPKGIPAIAGTRGEIPSNEIAFSVDRYELLVDGKQVCLVDVINCIHKVNGKDFAQNVNELL